MDCPRLRGTIFVASGVGNSSRKPGWQHSNQSPLLPALLIAKPRPLSGVEAAVCSRHQSGAGVHHVDESMMMTMVMSSGSNEQYRDNMSSEFIQRMQPLVQKREDFWIPLETEASADADGAAPEAAPERAAARAVNADETTVALDADGNLTAVASAVAVAGDTAVDGDVGLDLRGRAKILVEVDGVHCVVDVKVDTDRVWVVSP
jgi:hypothetical protein